MDNILQDLGYAIRALRKNPGFATVAVLTLALGIGANTAIFSVVNSVLLRPLPYPEPGRLVMVWESEKSGDPTLVSLANFVNWSEQSETCSHIAALRGWDANLSGVDEPQRLRGAMVSADLFTALGVAPVAGRTFLPEEDQPGRNRVVVLGYGLWRRRFGSDPQIVGKTIAINGINRTVIGIMPAQFKLPLVTIRKAPEQTEIWTPWAMDANYRKDAMLGSSWSLLDSISARQRSRRKRSYRRSATARTRGQRLTSDSTHRLSRYIGTLSGTFARPCQCCSERSVLYC
jgi:putative ABC transport system permease protein